FAEHGIGKGDLAIRADGDKLDEALGMADGEVAEEQGVDEREDGRIRADSESERKNCDGREARILGEDAEGVAQGLPEGFHCCRSRIRGFGVAPNKYANWRAVSSIA